MHREFEIIDPTNFNGWDDAVSSLPGATVFHSSSWARVLQESYGYTPMYLALRDGDDIQFALPLMAVKSFITGHRGVSLPFTDHCEPLVRNGFGEPQTFNDILDHTDSFGWKSLELRGGRNLLENTPFSVAYYGHTLDLSPGPGGINGLLRSSTRRNIKKAARLGVEVRIDNSHQSLMDFCRLNCLNRKRHGLPPQPMRFFRKIHDHIVNNGLGSLFVGRYRDETVAAAIYFHFDNRVIYKYGASDFRYQHTRANNLIMWEAIRHYAGSGYHSLDFGKTALDNEGLRNYKMGWGVKERHIKYYKYDFARRCFRRESPRESGWYNQLFAKMPVKVLSSVGTVLYRHIA